MLQIGIASKAVLYILVVVGIAYVIHSLLLNMYCLCVFSHVTFVFTTCSIRRFGVYLIKIVATKPSVT